MLPPSGRFRLISAAILVAAVSAMTVWFSEPETFGPAAVSAQSSTLVVNSNDYLVTPDDYQSIQRAIDDVNAKGGGAVYVPAGQQLTSKKIRLYSNVTLFGDGMDVTVIKFAPGAVLDHLMSNDSLSSRDNNIVIRDLTLSGPGPTTAPSSSCCFGLRLVNVYNSYVINVASDNHSMDGFYFGYYNTQGVDNVRLSGCRATNNGRNGISLTHGQNNVVDNCLIQNNNLVELAGAVDLEPDLGLNVSYNKVVSNQSLSNRNVGIALYSASRNQAVQGNNRVCTNTVRYNSNVGIYDYNGTKNVYVNNTSESNTGGNYVVDSSAIFSSDTATYCQLSALPAAPPKPGSGTGATSTPTATPTLSSTPTPTATSGPSTPAAPTNLRARAGVGTVQLTWTASTTAGVTYNIYRGRTSGGESSTPINTNPVTTTSYVDSVRGDGTRYYYYVKAQSATLGESARSNEVSAKPR